MAAVDPVPAPVPGAPASAAPAIEGVEALADRGERGARAAALRLVAAGLAACDVVSATGSTVALDGDVLVVAGERYELDPGGRVLVVGAGKASLAIATELERILGDRLDGGAIAIRGDQPQTLRGIEVIGSDHPLPTGRSIAAARRLLSIAESAGERDIVIACFTGGSSSLASLPPEGVSAAEKRDLHELLLSSGISIVEVNTVRKHVSAFKGGRLAAAAAPARLINLTVSDVAGDHIDAITDPSVADTSRAGDAIAILYGHGLWERVPASIRDHLQSAAAESPDLSGTTIQTVLLVTGATTTATRRAGSPRSASTISTRRRRPSSSSARAPTRSSPRPVPSASPGSCGCPTPPRRSGAARPRRGCSCAPPPWPRRARRRPGPGAPRWRVGATGAAPRRTSSRRRPPAGVDSTAARRRSASISASLERRPGEHHEELLAAEAVGEVEGAQLLAQRVGDVDEDRVAAWWPCSSLTRLEVVEVGRR